MAPRRPEALTGREIAGQFRLEEYLGRGRTTLVYRATDLTTGDQVAIKLLASSLSRDVGVMRRVRHVLRAASAMEHPNVLRVLAWGEERELFVVTELMAGPLRSLMGPGPSGTNRLSVGQTASMAVDAARGLAFLAERNLVHRRLHPSNLLVADDGRVVVGDAGLAWILAHESGHQFSDFRYLAPEAGSGTTGPAIDVYALGVIMAEALTGDVPLLAGDVNATLGLRHGTNLVLDESWGRIRSAVGAAGRSDHERRVPADRLDVGLMALIDQLDGRDVRLGRIDPAVSSDELEAMRLAVRDRLPEVAAQATAALGAATGATAPLRPPNAAGSAAPAPAPVPAPASPEGAGASASAPATVVAPLPDQRVGGAATAPGAHPEVAGGRRRCPARPTTWTRSPIPTPPRRRSWPHAETGRSDPWRCW
ncbi:MAG: protein kinase [Microthrixaceae bacterium]